MLDVAFSMYIKFLAVFFLQVLIDALPLLGVNVHRMGNHCLRWVWRARHRRLLITYHTAVSRSRVAVLQSSCIARAQIYSFECNLLPLVLKYRLVRRILYVTCLSQELASEKTGLVLSRRKMYILRICATVLLNDNLLSCGCLRRILRFFNWE